MPARRPHRLADRLTGIEIVAELDRIEPRITAAVGFGRPRRGATFAILRLPPVLWCDELRRQRYDAVMAWSHYGGRHKAVKILSRAAGTLARGAVGAANFVRAEVFRAVEGNQYALAKPSEVRKAAALLPGPNSYVEDREKAIRPNGIEHGANGIVPWNAAHLEQRLTVRAATPGTLRQSALMRQEGWALHEEHGKRRHAKVGHRVVHILSLSLVRKTCAYVFLVQHLLPL